MIIKENLNAVPHDKFEKAGYDAERKVAYYLKMAFGDEPKLLILHDLRVEFEDGITAQMDHLIIHQFGLIIIESKSVAGKLQAQEDGQWLRWFHDVKSNKDRNFGIQNPIKQGELQGKTLKRVLLNSSKENTRAVLESFPIDVLVTISDSGVFLAHNRALYPEVCKADQIEERVSEIVTNRYKVAKENDFKLSDTNQNKLAQHLLKIHKPFNNIFSIDESLSDNEVDKTKTLKQRLPAYDTKSQSKPVKLVDILSNIVSKQKMKLKLSCPYCKSDNLEIRFKRNSFFCCLDCDKNFPINLDCPTCKKPSKIRTSKKQFFAECSVCKTSELFHINK